MQDIDNAGTRRSSSLDHTNSGINTSVEVIDSRFNPLARAAVFKGFAVGWIICPTCSGSS